MTRKWSYAIAVSVLFASLSGAEAAQSILLNASLENGPGPFSEDPHIPLHWTRVGSVVERSGEANLEPALPEGEGFALKAFRSQNQEYAYQDVPIGPNVAANSVTISAECFTKAGDKLSGTGAFARIILQFYNGSGGQVGGTQLFTILTATSQADTWIPGSLTGPASPLTGVAKVRMSCFLACPSGTTGACFWDDAQLSITGVNGGANLLLNGDFEAAGVGEASPFGIDEWQGFNDQQQSGDFAYHGEKSVDVGTNAAYSGLTQTRDDYVVSAGDRLLLRARVMHSSANPLLGNSRAGIKLEFDETEGTALPNPHENLAINSNSTTNAWIEVDLDTTGLIVPEGAGKARVTLIFAPNTGSNGEIFFDAAFASLEGGSNLLANPSFESGGVRPDIWKFFETENESYALKSSFEVPGYPDQQFQSSAKAGGDNFAGFYQDIDVTPGQTLDANVQCRMRKETKLQGTSRAGIKIEWRTGLPDPVDIFNTPYNNYIEASDPPDTWIPLEIDFTMPVGAEAYPRFVTIMSQGTGTGGSAYFDACELVVVNRFDGADSDGDDDEDLRDFAEFQRCYNGDGAGDLGFNCTVFDDDEDLDVDMIDFAFFQPRLLGPLP